MANKTTEPSEAGPAPRQTDLHKTGRVNTSVETNTTVVDNTAADSSRRDIKWQEESKDLGNGVTLVTYGEPEGGFQDPGEDA